MVRKLLASQQAGLVAVIVLLGAILTAAAGTHIDRITGAPVNNFLNPYTLIQTATDASFFAIMAVGATIVIISGGIDLSVGSIYALSGVTMAMALRAMGAADPGTTVLMEVTIPPMWSRVRGVGRRRPRLRRRERADGRRAARAPVHHHARHDVGVARHRLRRQ